MAETVEVLSIVALDASGDGVAESGAIVPGALPGEQARVRLAGRQAEPIEVLSPSSKRAAPFCPWFGSCGGCAAQHMSESLYRAWKRGLVVQALKRARVDAEVGPLIDAHGAGRRRATFHAHAVQTARALAGDLRGLGRPLDIGVTATLEALDVDLRGSGPLDLTETRKITRTAERLDLARVSNHGAVVIEHRPPRVAFGEALVTLPPGGFLQATGAGEELLAEFAADAFKEAKKVADLFCGVGAFALRLARRREVFAADSHPASIAALERGAATTSGLRKIVVETRDLFRRPLMAEELSSFDGALFDPPRAGAEAQAREFAASALPLIVAVSCNAATFARDARLLVEGGFRLETVAPLDQFRFSPHVEIAAVFRRPRAKPRARRLLG